MFIETEETPNPNVIKFLPGRAVSPDAPHDYTSLEKAQNESPLAASLFKIQGVKGVFLGSDFISITRDDAADDWAFLKTDILAGIMDAFMTGIPIFATNNTTSNTVPQTNQKDEDDDPITSQIKAILDEHVRPAVAMDGGDIIFDHFDTNSGIVYLHLRGACSGCPSASMTLKSGVENLLQHFVPEVKSVEAVL